MQPRTQEVLDLLDTHRATLADAVRAVPEPLRGRRPAPERWSVAEILEHLGIVEGNITQLLRARIDAGQAEGLGPERDTSEAVSKALVDRVLDRSARITTSARSQPTGNMDADAAWDVLVERRRDLEALVRSADGLALGQIIAPHPVFGPLDVYQWLAFVGAHEGRHAQQIREAAEYA
jgi:DinB superfamily